MKGQEEKRSEEENKQEESAYRRYSEIVARSLERLPGPHKLKKRQTVVAIVDARLAGRSVDSVFGLPQTCARNTWHSKWKHDETVAEVLEEVEAAMMAEADAEALAMVGAAWRKLQLNSLGAVDMLVTQLGNENGSVAVRAAKEILDRASPSTGSGSGSPSASSGDEDDVPIAVVNFDMERV